MKANEIRDFNEQEITQRIGELEAQLVELRFRRTVAGLESPIVLREHRREIARLKTILNEKRRAAASEASAAE